MSTRSSTRNSSHDRVSDHDLQVYTVLGGPEDFQFVTFHHHTRFVLIIRRPEIDFDGDVISEWLSKLEETGDDPDEMVHHRYIGEVQERLLSTCKDMIYSLSNQTATPEPISLQDHIFPATVYLEVTLRNGTLQPSIMRDASDYTPQHEPTYLDAFLSQIPGATLISTRSLQYVEDLYGDQILKVSRSGHFYIFKSAHVGNKDQLEREIRVLSQLAADSKLKDCSLLPQLQGIVTSNDQVVGLLANYIDGENLHGIEVSNIAYSQRLLWKQQIEQAIQMLHQRDIIWGDVKPGNIMIDRDSNARLIDFGGSYTEGWVPGHLAGTIEGDLQGLTKIIHYLELRR